MTKPLHCTSCGTTDPKRFDKRHWRSQCERCRDGRYQHRARRTVSFDNHTIELPRREAEVLQAILSGITTADGLKRQVFGEGYCRHILWTTLSDLRKHLAEHGVKLTSKHITTFRLEEMEREHDPSRTDDQARP